MNRPKLESKKFTAMIVGTATTILIYAAGIIAIMFVPKAATSITNLGTIALASMASVISLYAVGQSAVDWKLNSNTSTTQTHNIEEKRQYEMKYE